MSKPWEKYQQLQQSGPWEKFKDQPTDLEADTAQQPQPRSQLAALGGALGQGVGNVALGAQNLLGMGLEKIGAQQAGKWLQQDAMQGKQKLQSEIAPYEQAHPLTVGAGRLGGEFAATLPVGGALGKVAGYIPGAGGLAQALRTGGATGPNMATRIAGGAMTGGATSALIDQDSAGTGASIGAALPVVGKVAGMAGGAARRVFGATTGVGDEALKQAYKAGKAGGEQGQSFVQALRGQSNMDDVLSVAKQNLDELGRQRQEAYLQGMAAINKQPDILKFDDINQAVKSAANIGAFKGQTTNPQAADAVSKAAQIVDDWMRLDPVEYHTAQGLDALKKKVGSVLESIPFEQKTALRAVNGIYNAVKNTIVKQDPTYAKTMKGYEEASGLIKEIERSLSLNNRASADTAMRKLQSLMRNNVNTSYGYRDQLARQLEDAGGQQFMPMLAGQALSEWAPRGLQRAGAATGGGLLAMTGNIPAAVGMGAISSPRVAGETAYLLGKASNIAPPSVLDALRLGAYRSAPVIGSQ